MGKSILAISLIILLSACGGEYTTDTRRDGTTVDTTTLTTDTTTTGTDVPASAANAFSEVLPVLQTKCMACHGTSGSFTLGTSSNPLSEADAYNNVMVYVINANSAGETPLLQKGTNSLSNHGGGAQLSTSSNEYMLIENWINAGSSLLGTGTTTGGTTTTPTDTNTTTGTDTTPTATGTKTFSDVLTGLQSKCMGCHGTDGGFTLGSNAAPSAEATAYNNIIMFTSGTSIAGNTRLLQKATGNAHGGGTILNTTSYEYLITSKWIEDGMPLTASFEMNTSTTTPTTPVVNPGYDVPTSTAKSFTKNHKDGFGPVQGKACIQCHDSERTDPISLGGTLFSYIHTPNAKYYQDLSSYRVNIVGENGSSITATTRSSGSEIGHNNFSSVSGIGSNVNFTAYVKDSNGDVVNQSGTNTHNSSTHLDCNRCHTEAGANNAPGRVLVPLVN